MRKDATSIVCLLLAIPAASAFAQEDLRPDPGERLRFVHTPWGQTTGDDAPAPEPRYGQEHYASWMVSYSTAFQGDSLDQGITLSYNRFLVDDIEWLLEAGMWSFYDRGGDAAYGLSAGLGFRWHFLTREKWTLFADVGISVLGTTDAVPPNGTEFNFMPRAGFGFTHEIANDVRFIGGVRWHHISNARTRGDSRNPSRDAPLFYAGLVFSF